MFHKSISVLVFATFVLISNIHGANVKLDNFSKDSEDVDDYFTSVSKHDPSKEAHSTEFLIRHTRELRVNSTKAVLKSGNTTSIHVSNTNISLAQNTSKQNECLQKIKDGMIEMIQNVITNALSKNENKNKNNRIFKGPLKALMIEKIANEVVEIGVNIAVDEIQEFMENNNLKDVEDIKNAVEEKTKEIFDAVKKIFKTSAEKLKQKGKNVIQNIG